MTALEYVGWALLVIAIIVQLFIGRRFVNLYAKRYHAFPTWRWLFTSVGDAEVERWRRYSASAPILAIAGLVVLFVGIATSGSAAG